MSLPDLFMFIATFIGTGKIVLSNENYKFQKKKKNQCNIYNYMIFLSHSDLFYQREKKTKVEI